MRDPPGGSQRDQIRATVENPERTVLTQPLAAVPTGKHPVALRLLDATGRVVAEQTTGLRKEPPARR